MTLVGVLLDKDGRLCLSTKCAKVHSVEHVLIIEILSELAFIEGCDATHVIWCQVVPIGTCCSLCAAVSSHSVLSKIKFCVIIFITNIK